MAEIDELIVRLHISADQCFKGSEREEVQRQAADALARLQAEIERKDAAGRALLRYLPTMPNRLTSEMLREWIEGLSPLVAALDEALSTAPTPAESGETRAKITALDSDDLAPWGWAPGLYLLRCSCVPADAKPIDWPMGAKRSARCEACARKAKEVFRATAMPAEEPRNV